MTQANALRRETQLLPHTTRRAIVRAESHPSNEELDAYRAHGASKSMTKALERHVGRCDRCTQRVADMVWHALWERLGN